MTPFWPVFVVCFKNTDVTHFWEQAWAPHGWNGSQWVGTTLPSVRFTKRAWESCDKSMKWKLDDRASSEQSYGKIQISGGKHLERYSL